MKTRLQWFGKESVSHKKKKPTGTLKELASLRVEKDPTAPHHRIFEGDNASIMRLKAKEWKEKFDCIYIDPPYNTGNTDFFYSDRFREEKVDDPHAAWLSFMQERLLLARDFLHDEGAIFISIDDSELYHLKLVCDEIFGEAQFVANFIRKNKSGAGHDSKQVAIEFDYVLCYAKKIQKLTFSKDDAFAEADKKYRLQDDYQNRRGKFYLRDLDYKGSYSPSLDYPLTMPDGTIIWPGGKKGKPNTWRWSQEKVKWGVNNDFIVFKKRPAGWKAYIKQYQFVDNQDKKRVRKIPHRAMIEFSNAKGSFELRNVLTQSIFSYPKPIGLVRFILNLFENKKLNVLDFFAGSGTTLHAVMEQNADDGGKRSCVLINNNENNICRKVTYERNKRVIKGYTNAKGKKVKGLSNNQLSYFKFTNGVK